MWNHSGGTLDSFMTAILVRIEWTAAYVIRVIGGYCLVTVPIQPCHPRRYVIFSVPLLSIFRAYLIKFFYHSTFVKL